MTGVGGKGIKSLGDAVSTKVLRETHLVGKGGRKVPSLLCRVQGDEGITLGGEWEVRQEVLTTPPSKLMIVLECDLSEGGELKLVVGD